MPTSPSSGGHCLKRTRIWRPSVWGYIRAIRRATQEDLNFEVWSSRLGVGRWTDNPPRQTHFVKKPKEKHRNERIQRRRNMELRLKTWNVRSLYETAAARSLVEKLAKHRIQILALQETRWKENNIIKIGNYHFFCSGGQRHMLVGFAIHKELLGNILEFRPVHDRICVIRVKSRFFNLSLISAHAETEEKKGLIEHAFYNMLEQTYDSMPFNDIKIVLGDLNAKIGREIIHRPIIGKESLYTHSNNNGLRTIDFAAEYPTGHIIHQIQETSIN